MGKVLLINGSPNERGCTYTALCEVQGALERRGVATELLQLGRKPVPGCIACGHCSGTGRCVFDDSVNRVLDELDGIDGIFVGPYDLSVALGAPARFATPRFAEALGRVIAACRASGKLAFIYANTMPEARAYFAQGYQGAAIGTDTAFLVKAIQGMLQA